MENIVVKRHPRFNIIRSEMTKTGLLKGGRLIAGDKEYTSYDEAVKMATELFISEGAPELVQYSVIGGIVREHYHYAQRSMAEVYLSWENGKRQIKGEVCVHELPMDFHFVLRKDGYPMNFFNQPDNKKEFVHPTMSK